MELMERLETALANIIFILEWLLEAIAVLCVLLGLVATIRLVFKITRRQRVPFPYFLVRLRFGIWLTLALEFQVGADILATTITPNLEALGKLAAIAVIRTFLNYFLNKELETVYELQESSREGLSEITN